GRRRGRRVSTAGAEAAGINDQAAGAGREGQAGEQPAVAPVVRRATGLAHGRGGVGVREDAPRQRRGAGEGAWPDRLPGVRPGPAAVRAARGSAKAGDGGAVGELPVRAVLLPGEGAEPWRGPAADGGVAGAARRGGRGADAAAGDGAADP